MEEMREKLPDRPGEAAAEEGGETVDPTAADLDGVRPPRQERSRRTLDRIAEAALALLAERGAEGTTVQDIVGRARSSVGSFYARFDGKEDLLRYLDERVLREAREQWDVAVGQVDPEEGGLEDTVGAVVRMLLDAHAHGVPGHGPSDGLRAFRARVRDDVARLLLSHRGRIGHPNSEAAVRFLVRVLEAAIPAVAGPSDAEADVDPAHELHRLALAYLGRPRGASDRADRVDFFDVWG